MREDSLLVNVKLLHTWHRSLKAGLILKGICKVPWNNGPMEQVTLEQAEDEGRPLHVRQIGIRTRLVRALWSWNSESRKTLSVDGAWVGYICDEPWEMRWVQPSCSRRCILAQGRGDARRWWMVESIGTQARQWLGRCPSTELGLEDLKFGLGSATSNYRNLSRSQSPHKGHIKAFWGPGHICLCGHFSP